MEDTANSGSEDKPEPQGPGSPASSGPPSNSDALNAVMASFLGWAFDAFDFFVLVFVLSKAAKEFAVSLDKMTLAITATLAFRPIGALLFGALADRYGRRVPLMWNLAFFSVMEVLSGLAPNFSSFMLCRCLFGVGMGGEWGLGAALSMEKVPPRWRGVVSGLLQQGYPFGYLLAACCFRLMRAEWSWRLLFFAGALPTVLAIWFLYRVRESGRLAKKPAGKLGQSGPGHTKELEIVPLLDASDDADEFRVARNARPLSDLPGKGAPSGQDPDCRYRDDL